MTFRLTTADIQNLEMMLILGEIPVTMTEADRSRHIRLLDMLNEMCSERYAYSVTLTTTTPQAEDVAGI